MDEQQLRSDADARLLMAAPGHSLQPSPPPPGASTYTPPSCAQVFSFIDVQLFNQLLLRPDCCCTSNARYVLEGLKRLDRWIMSGSDDYLAVLYRELRHVRQVRTRGAGRGGGVESGGWGGARGAGDGTAGGRRPAATVAVCIWRCAWLRSGKRGCFGGRGTDKQTLALVWGDLRVVVAGLFLLGWAGLEPGAGCHLT